MSLADWQRHPAGSNGGRGRRWSTLTITGLILSGLGFTFAFASGIGLPFALAGTVCGAIAMRRDQAAKPWPVVALTAGIVGFLIGGVVLVVTLVTWAPLLPGLLPG